MFKNISSYHIKILVLMLCLSIIPTFVLSAIIISDQTNADTDELRETLVSTSKSGANQISSWIDVQKNQMRDIATDQLVVSETKLLQSDSVSDDKFESLVNLEKKIGNKLDENEFLNELIITSHDSKNYLFYSDFKSPKIPLKNIPSFSDVYENKFKISDIFFSEKPLKNEFGKYEFELPALLISHSIVSEIGPVGILSAIINFNDVPLFTPVENKFESLDNYIINQNGNFISTPRFIISENLESEFSSKILENYKTSDSSVNLDGYRNYQDKLVVGSIHPIEGTDWFYVAEVDKNEAFLEIYQLQTTLYSSIGILFSLIVFVSLFFTSNLVKPIQKLQDATQKVKSGDLSVKIESSGNDEIHELSNSFQSMVDSLNESQVLRSQAESKYRNLYEHSPALHRTVDIEGKILDCNESYAKRFGYSKKEIIGSSIFDHVSPENLEFMCSVFESWIKHKNVTDTEIWFKTKDGEKFPGLISVNSLYDKDHNLIGSNTLIQDISDFYKTLEAEEEKKNMTIEMDQVKLLNKQKDEFLSIVSHELRTPLLPIKGNCEILLDENFADKITDEQRKYIESIVSNSKRLDALIDKILLTQKLDLNKYQFAMEKVSSNTILDDIFQSYAPTMEEHNIQFVNSINKNYDLFCDENALHEIFTNLINNAMGFVPKENAAIEIGAKEMTGVIEFFVKDNGVGVSEKKQNRIFDKFYQLDSTHTRTHGGLGLGLSICQKLVLGMGGEIRVMSKEGKGTTFYFTIRRDKIENSHN